MEYKKLNEVDIKESIGDSEHVLAVAESGDVVKIPKTAIQTQQVLVIDCPDFSEAGWTDEGTIKTWIECETLGGYTIDELKEIIKNGCVVRLKYGLSPSNATPYSVMFYDVVGIGTVRNTSDFYSGFSDKETIVFGAIYPMSVPFMDGSNNEIYCEPGYVTATNNYQFKMQTLIWTGHELIIEAKDSPYNNEEEDEEL